MMHISVESVIHNVLWIYNWVIIIRAVMSWFNPDPYNPLVRLIRGLTDPFLDLIRRVIPTNISMIDIAPIIALVLVMLVDRYVVPGIFSMINF